MSTPPTGTARGSRSYEEMIERLRDAEVLFSALFELTYRCNLDCFFCYNDLERRGRGMRTDDWRRALDQLRALGALEIGLSGGEPMVHSGFFDIGRHATSIGLVVRVKTNGHLLDAARIERLLGEVRPFLLEISLHGAHAASHERQTRVPGSFERLLANLEAARDAGLRIQLKTALTRWNEDEIDDLVALAERLELPLAFDTVVTPRDDGDTSPLTIAPSRTAVAHLEALLVRRRAGREQTGREQPAQAERAAPRKNCGTGSTTVTVDPFGNVFPCVQWRRPLGNLHEQSLAEIWKGSPVLDEVRRLNREAGARHAGVDGFCLGLAEQLTGDPLAAYGNRSAGAPARLPVVGQDV